MGLTEEAKRQGSRTAAARHAKAARREEMNLSAPTSAPSMSIFIEDSDSDDEIFHIPSLERDLTPAVIEVLTQRLANLNPRRRKKMRMSKLWIARPSRNKSWTLSKKR